MSGSFVQLATVRCALAILLALCADRVGAAPPVRIVCLGDSVTKAVRLGVEPQQTFCALLEKELTTAERPVEVVNAGVGGNTTADGLARFERDVLAREPVGVVIMFGLNDSWIDAGTSPSRLTTEQFRDNLKQMIATLKSRGVQVVLMTPNPAIAPTYGPERNRTLKPYVEAVRQIAREEDLALVDVYARFAELGLEGADVNGLFTDAMHPNPAGQKLIADLLAPSLRSIVTAKQ